MLDVRELNETKKNKKKLKKTKINKKKRFVKKTKKMRQIDFLFEFLEWPPGRV